MAYSYDLVLWLHVAVMGYWLGSDFVLQGLTHYFKNAKDLSIDQRIRLWDFLLLVDQHPRNALILSLPLGFTLAADLQLSPIQGPLLAALWIASLAWFALIWVLHYQIGKPGFRPLAQMDLTLRYSLIALLGAVGIGSVLTEQPLEAKWLGAKVALFALVIVCGLGIRHYIAKVYAVFPAFKALGSTPEIESVITDALNKGSYVLWCLWALVLAIGLLGVFKPF